MGPTRPQPHAASVSASGVENPAMIDLVAHDPSTDELVLILRETRPWDATDRRLFQLQEKLNSYLSFLFDGECAEAYPELVQKQCRFQLECLELPDARTLTTLEKMRTDLAAQKIDFVVRVRESLPTASLLAAPTCACHPPVGTP
jgi:hypothetical protein